MKRDHADMLATGGDGSDDDNNSQDANDDSADKIPPYDATTEKLPSSPVFTPEYEKLMKDIKLLTAQLVRPIDESKYRDNVVKGLIQEVKNRTKSDYPEEVRIALIGDMKAGKSSVINSILSTGMIARQGDAGGSCTWVVQEFCYLLPNQKKSFAAEVTFFNQEQRYDIIKTLLADYFRASPKDGDIADGPKDGDQTVEDHATMRTTVQVFRALFNNHKEFATFSAANAFLGTMQTEDDEAIVETLCDWADDLIARGMGKDSVIRTEAATTQSLLWDLAPYLYTVEERDGEPIVSLWPFVSHIKFGLDNELLKHDITLVDLPGLSDANKTRVTNATNHLRQCSHYMIVAEIGRADDDKFIREHLTKGCMTRGYGRTMLILTHADTIDDETEVSGPAKDFQTLDKLRIEMKNLDKKKMEMGGRIKSAKGMEKYEYMEAKDQIAVELREKKAKYQEQRINMRSRMIVRKMQSLYEELTPDPHPLPVFCVGNAAYKKHQAGYSLEDPNPPSLTVEATMIPALRQHLWLAPAEAKLNEAQHMVATQLPALIACFEMYVKKTHMARKGEVQRMVLKPRSAAMTIVDDLAENLDRRAEECILEPFRYEETEWVEEARTMCKDWAKCYPTGQHLQFLKRDGIKKGKGKNALGISWNSELISINSAEFRRWFGNFSASIDQLPKTVTKGVNALLNRIIHDIRNDPQVTLMALQPFLDYLYVEKGNIGPKVEKLIRNLRKEIGNIQGRAMSESADNHIVQAMIPVYAEAREIKGVPNAPKNRLLNFERGVTRHGLGVWMRAHDAMRSQLEEMTARHCAELKKAILEFFIGIDQKFNIMCSDKEVEDPEEEKLREKLQKGLVLAKERLACEVRPTAQVCFGRG